MPRGLAALLVVIIFGLALTWAFLGGTIVDGQWLPFALALSLGPALYVITMLFRSIPNVPARWAVMAVGISLATLAYRQPWSERQQFVSAIYNMPIGTPEASVRAQLARLIAVNSESLPNEHSEALNGATQRLIFRCSESKGCGNADLGLVYLREGRVVLTAFSAD